MEHIVGSCNFKIYIKRGKKSYQMEYNYRNLCKQNEAMMSIIEYINKVITTILTQIENSGRITVKIT
jgi:hypothetical protein